MKKIIELLYENKEFMNINKAYFSAKNSYIKNTNEDNALLTIGAIFNNAKDTMFIITPNLYKAQQAYDKLSMIVNKDDICFFPQDEFITNEMLASSLEFRFERINTIKKLLKNSKRIVVLNLFGALKPELSRKKWLDSLINLKTGEEYNIKELSEKLINFGYTREYTVEKVGDFSVRGGIVDIFPLGSENPYRIDFFGEEIDKIKEFSVENQRSLNTIENFEITPLAEFFYSNKELVQIEKKINDKLSKIEFSEDAQNIIRNDLELLKNHDELDRLIRYLPFLSKEHISILDMVEKSHLIFLDYHRVLEKNKILLEEIKEWYMESSDYIKMDFNMIYDINDILIKPKLCIDYLEYKYRETFDFEISLFSKEVIAYNNNIEYLFKEIESNIDKITIVIAFDKKKALLDFSERLKGYDIPFLINNEKEKIKVDKINLIVDKECIDLHSVSYSLMIITEDALKKKYIPRKRGDYVKIYKNAQSLSSINDLKPGDYIVHYDYGIGRFLEIKTMKFGNTQNDYIHIEYRGGDKLYVSLDAIDQIHKYTASEGFRPRLSKLGGKEWSKTKERVRKQVKEIAERLVRLYAERENSEGYTYESFPEIENEFKESFPYIETKDQLNAINDVLSDMSKTPPMDRLICGDVGFGKTEIALRAAFKAVLNGKQVAYLAPTTVLSKQHYDTFVERMNDFGVSVALMNRFITKKQQRETLKKLKEGTVDILIGTHRILSKDVIFRDLGLLVIDEEQRFGVMHKEKIKEMKVTVDVLSLSATPIPRTLNMAIMGVKSMSMLETAPENRYPIQTYVIERNDIIIRDAIERELARKGQVFYLYNRVENIDFIADRIQKLVPEANIEIIHGKMRKSDLEKVVNNFINKEIDVLISTTIIETGIDIPNANTLIVHDADMLGLSQLYQIRGRVGRSDRIAYAYLMYKKNKILTEEAEKRLKVIKEFTELGSGFKIAIRDLSIRGAGDVLGQEQSGFIDSVGIDMYMKILEEEISNKKGKAEKKIESPGVKTNVSKFIDKNYIEDDYIKIEMHKKIKDVQTIAEAKELLEEITDRFGKYDTELEIYIYEKLFENLTKVLNVEKKIETRTNVTLILSQEGTKKIASENLFKTSIDVSNQFRFAFKSDKFRIILDTLNLDKHWLFTMVDFLENLLINRKHN